MCVREGNEKSKRIEGKISAKGGGETDKERLREAGRRVGAARS